MSAKVEGSSPKKAKKVDPKVWNLTKFVVTKVGGIGGFCYAFIWYTQETDWLRLLGYLTLLIIALRIGTSVYRRLILPAKHPLAYGKWAIVTGTTSGIGKEFSEHLAKLGMSLMLISRSESSLAEQAKKLTEEFKVETRYMVYDFGESQIGPKRDAFYAKLDEECKRMTAEGGVGILVNNVGINTDKKPLLFEEFTDAYVNEMINCNMLSTIWMTRTVHKHMKTRANGCVITVSSGSANHPGPFNSLYSATKAFGIQFSRSMHVENWGTGVDFYVCTPFYIVSNLFKRKEGTILAPMPDALVKGTLAQIGKKYVWEGHGYWFHGLLGNVASVYWDTTDRWRFMMTENRRRADEKEALELSKGDAKKD